MPALHDLGLDPAGCTAVPDQGQVGCPITADAKNGMTFLATACLKGGRAALTRV